MILLLPLAVIGFVTLGFVLTGLIRHDIAEIRFQRMAKKHPHARKLRERPVLYAVAQNTKSESYFKVVKKHEYKKLIISYSQPPADAVELLLSSDTQLARGSLMKAVQQLVIDPSRKSVSLTPIVTLSYSIPALFRVYHFLARLPFSTAASGFGFASNDSLSRRATASKQYTYAAIILKSTNLLMFVYACFTAVYLQQPQFILIYLCALSFWLTWSILRYPYFSLLKKLGLILLSPVSFIYFIYRTIAAPFVSTTLQRPASDAIVKI